MASIVAHEEEMASTLAHEELEVVVSAPGKIILSGEHSVVYPGCPAIAASINKRCRCRLKVVSGDSIVLELKSLDHTFQMSLRDFNALELTAMNRRLADVIVIKQKENASEIKNAVIVILFLLRVMVLMKGELNVGVVLTITSELVLGAGSGSSAAFAVSVAGAAYTLGRWLTRNSVPNNASHDIEEVYQPFTGILSCDDTKEPQIQHSFSTFWNALRHDPEKWDTINSEFDQTTINFFALQAEKITHGKPSGLDNTVCTLGGLVTLTRREQGKPTIVCRDTLYPLEILLIDTGVSRSTANLVKKVADLKTRHEHIFSPLLQTFTAVTTQLSDTLERMSKVDDVESEFQKLKELVVMNQGLLSSLGVSHPSLNRIIDVCCKYDLPAKLTGAGGGGFAYALVPPGFSRDRLELAVMELEKEGFKVTSGIKLGEPGIELEVITSKDSYSAVQPTAI